MTETAVSVSAHQRIREVSSSPRMVDTLTATAPATTPSSSTGAITCQ
jgi:hypothetical protein